MLGDLLYEGEGKITGKRVLDVTHGPKIEVSLSREGKMRGVEVTELLTYCAMPKNDKTIHGEGQGVVMIKDGTEIATYTAQGIGRVKEQPGIVSFRGSFFFQTSSRDKLVFLSNLVGVSEGEDDMNSIYSSIRIWEWK